MTDFLYPILSVVLDFICILLCIRCLVSRRGAVWILPILLSTGLLLGSLVCLLSNASQNTGEALAIVMDYASIYLFAISTIWMVCIIFLGKATKRNVSQLDDRKTRAESEYVAKRTAPESYRRKANPHPVANVGIADVRHKASPAKKRKRKPRPTERTVSALRIKRTSFARDYNASAED